MYYFKGTFFKQIQMSKFIIFMTNYLLHILTSVFMINSFLYIQSEERKGGGNERGKKRGRKEEIFTKIALFERLQIF